MDNMATGFAFGMSGDDFGNIDFHTPPMGGEGEGGHPTPAMMAGMNQYPPFNQAMPRDAVFSQAGMMPPRSSMDLPRFPMGAYGGGTDSLASGNFDSLMPPRHAYPSGGMSVFGDLYSTHLPQSEARVAAEITGSSNNNIADHMGGFGSVMSPPSSSSPGVMPSSMPVFPNTPSSMIHTAMGTTPDLAKKHDDSDHGQVKGGSSLQSPSSHGYKSPLRSPPPPMMQTCFPGPVPASMTLQQQGGGGGTEVMPGPMVSPHGKSQAPPPAARYKEERDFSGGPSDPVASLVIGSEVTPMQRRRQSPRRANMLAQEAAAAAAAVLAVETKQAPMPPMLSARDSHLLGAIPHSMAFPPSMVAPPLPVFNSSHQPMPDGFPRMPSRRGRRTRISGGDHGAGYHFDQVMDANTGISRKHAVVPFFKAGQLSTREPEMFEGMSRKAPLVTQATQTGQGSCKEDFAVPISKPHPAKDSKYADIDPTDGKGGFPLSSYSSFPSTPHHQPFRTMPVSHRASEDCYTKGFVEGEGYAKRGNSKTVVSPSFGEAAARAVMTTSVGDSATVVTVAIMSRQTSSAKTRLASSALSPRPSTSHDSGDDLKENMNISSPDPLDPSGADGASSGVMTRRGRRSGSSITNTMPMTSSRGRTLRRRTDPDNISIEDDENFEMMMEDRKEKARAAEQERMEISIRIDDSQCITYGDQKRWQCELCNKSYTTKHNLVMHMLDHNGIKPHLCLVCGKYFKQLSHLNTHMLTHDKVRPHVCPSCGKGFTQISHLKRHQAVHLDSKPYSCDECGRGFTFPSELRIHKERHVSGRYIDHTCPECGEEFASGALLRQHEVIHENRSNLSCSYCSRNFRYPSQLRDHVVIHSNSRPYMCTECGMDFMKEHHLRSHQFTHTGLRPYSCPVCGRAFNQRANMQRHMLIHKAERSYRCQYCEKSFTQPQTLKAHMVVHADHKPYQCNLCGKEFGRLHNLHGHMHMHNNSKPYICFCGSSFTLKGNLNRHKKVKHGLNESTENMEEDAVHFLSSWSERARSERLGDESMDGYDLNGANGQMDGLEGMEGLDGNMDGNMDGNDMDGSSLDVMDKSSSRKQRKSTPRKIPRRSAGGRKRTAESTGEDGEEENEDGEEEVDEEDLQGDHSLPVHFEALTDDHDDPNVDTTSSRKRQTRDDDSADQMEGEASPPKRSRRDRSRQYAAMANGDFVAGLSDSEREEGEGEPVDDDADWLPGEGPHKNGKGAKLDSLIAEKFKSS
ncbi:uncharacterized protein LOC143282286 [Babylonia areolata]|uniref:uncharacterized protein LOC143282286 n=1 Tax=Babylonia areolata TaxID=304850 RepID=UPI003FD69CA4